MQAVTQLENEVMITPQSVDLIKDVKIINKENKAGLQVLKHILDNKKDKVVIKGKRHIEFEDWIALANAYGVTVRTGDAQPIEVFEAKGFKARAEVIRLEDGVVIGGAEAMCLNNEKNWRNKDYFQMASMAQTRAGSKALSNVLRFVVALDKSLSGTPAEEMVNMRRSTPRRRTPSQPSPAEDDDAINVAAKVKEPKTTLTLDEALAKCQPLRAIVKNIEYLGDEPTLETIKSRVQEDYDTSKMTKESHDEIMKLLERVEE